MPDLNDIGGKIYQQANASADFVFTPNQDRAAIVKKIRVVNPSAADTFVITVNGKDLCHVPVHSVGNQQFFGKPDSAFPFAIDMFTVFKKLYGYPLTFPVPQSTSLEVKSVGGATADIFLVADEVSSTSVNPAQVNHPSSNHYIIPIFASKSAAITAAGEYVLDNIVAPSWVPSFFNELNVPAAWRGVFTALFIEAASVNKYAATTDHISRTEYVALLKNGTRMYTRAGKGFPNVATLAAAGSANTVYGGVSQAYPPLQELIDPAESMLDQPINMMGGDNLQFLLAVDGDFTGGADYSKVFLAAFLDLTYNPQTTLGF